MLQELIKFWNINNFNKSLIFIAILVLISVVYFLNQEPFMMWYFPDQDLNADYKSSKIKKFPGGFQDPNSIYIDKFELPPPANSQDNWPLYKPENPFNKLKFQDERENFGPFGFNPRFGINPNFCSIGKNGKSCYSDDCNECQSALEQDMPINGSIKTRPSQQMYN